MLIQWHQSSQRAEPGSSVLYHTCFDGRVLYRSTESWCVILNSLRVLQPTKESINQVVTVINHTTNRKTEPHHQYTSVLLVKQSIHDSCVQSPSLSSCRSFSLHSLDSTSFMNPRKLDLRHIFHFNACCQQKFFFHSGLKI